MSHHDHGIDCETFCGGTPDDLDYCPVCGSPMEHVECWQCHGDGGFHDCGEDCCPCLDKDEITVDCEECDGRGRYLECTALPHTDEQIKSYSDRQDQDDALRSGGR